MPDQRIAIVAKELFEVLSHNIPQLFEAANYLEKEDRLKPEQVFIEARDVLSHLNDICNNYENEEIVAKSMVEIKEHFRRGIVETYQEHYEFVMSNMWQSYGNYKKSLMKFESLLFLKSTHLTSHSKIKDALNQTKDLWINARKLKNNEITSSEFKDSITKLKEASDLALTVEGDINDIYNNFYKRATIFTFSIITFMIFTTYVLLHF